MGRTLRLGTTTSTASVGQTYHYQSRALRILTVGGGGPGGLETDEGVSLPLGTIYTMLGAGEIGDIWETTGPHAAVQRIELQKALLTSNDSGGSPSSPSTPGGGESEPSGSAATGASWFEQETELLGYKIPNLALIGIGIFAVLALGKKR